MPVKSLNILDNGVRVKYFCLHFHRYAAIIVALLLALKANSQATVSCGIPYFAGGAAGSTVVAAVAGLPTSISNSLFVMPTNIRNSGLALGSNLGYTAPNPTLWAVKNTTLGPTLCYYDGSTFATTAHTVNVFNNDGMGFSSNFLYVINSIGNVYKYNGTNTPTLCTTLTGAAYREIVGDDNDNFYVLDASALRMYASNGNYQCYKQVTGLPTNLDIDAFAISGNTITAQTIYSLYVGLLNTASINFSVTTKPFPITIWDYANCPLITQSTSTITASSQTLDCLQTGSISINTSIINPIFNWAGPGITSAINTQSIQINKPGIYSCSVTNSECPPKTSFATYTIVNSGNFFSAAIVQTGSLTCLTPTVQLSASPSGSNLVFSWIGPGIGFNVPGQSVSANQAGNYYLSVTNTLTGCSDAIFQNVSSAFVTPTLSYSIADTLLCLPAKNSTTINLNGAQSYSIYAQSNTPILFSSSVQITPTLATTYTLVGSTGICTSSTTVFVNVLNTPTLVTSPNTTVCPGTPVTLTATGAGSYLFLPEYTTDSIFTFNAYGLNEIELYGYNGNCVATKTIVVNAPLTILQITGDTSFVCFPTTSQTLIASGAATYTWLPLGLNTSTISISPTVTTSYSLIGTTTLGCSAQITKQIVVLMPGSNAIVANITGTICSNNQNLNLYSANNFLTYTWSPGSTNNYSVNITQTVSPTYTLAVSDGSCVSTSTYAIQWTNPPQFNINLQNDSICSGSSVTMSLTSISQCSLLPGYTPLNSVNSFSPMSTTVFSIISGPANCSFTQQAFVFVDNPLNVNVTVSSSSVCSGNYWQGSISGALSYKWLPSLSTTSSYSFNPATSTTLNVMVKNTNCVDTISIPITVIQKPSINFTPSTPTVCEGQSVQLVASGASTYYWLVNTSTSNVISVSPTLSTTYTVVGSQSNCASAGTIAVQVYPNPTISILGIPDSICSGESFVASFQGASNFTLFPNVITGNSFTLMPLSNTVYTVAGSNTWNCIATETHSLIVNATPTVWLAFSKDTICPNEPVTLFASGAANFTLIPFTPFNGSLTLSPITSSNYTVFSSVLGCNDTASSQLQVRQKPTITSSGKLIICSKESTILGLQGTNSFTWLPNFSGQNLTIQPLGDTLVQAIGSDNFGCISDTLSIQIFTAECLSNSEFSQKRLTFYPNPFQNKLNFELNEAINYCIYDATGHEVLFGNLNATQSEINTSEWPLGLYHLYILGHDFERSHFKIIKD